MAEGEQADETADTVARPNDDDTAVVPDTPPTLAAEALAWSAAEPDGWSETQRGPLSRVLIFLLGGVCVGGLTLAAFMVGQHRAPTPPSSAPSTVQSMPSVTQSGPPPAQSAPAAPAPTSVPPPPVTTVTVQAEPPAPQGVPPPGGGQDIIYLAELQRRGIRVDNRDNAITAGHTVCTALRQGHSPAEIAASVMRSNPTFSEGIAAASVDAAITAYCPEQRRGE